VTLGARNRALPIAPVAAPARRLLPLADGIRPVDRGWRPVYAGWEVTLKCDLACRHCGSRAGHARPDELSTKEALDLVRQMAELGVREVTLIGGEAYLRDDWLDIVRAIRHHGMECTTTTGARGITDAIARDAKAAGIQGASVSVDGLRSTHDHIRALEGSFDAAMNGLRAFRAAGIPVATNTHINRINLREIPELFELLVAQGIHSWLMQLTVAMGRAADEERLHLEPYQVLEVLPMLARVKRRADQAKVRFWAGNNIGYSARTRAPCVLPTREGTWGPAGRAGTRSASRPMATSRCERREEGRRRGRGWRRDLTRCVRRIRRRLKPTHVRAGQAPSAFCAAPIARMATIFFSNGAQSSRSAMADHKASISSMSRVQGPSFLSKYAGSSAAAGWYSASSRRSSSHAAPA
jgi:MoaA/NifB/PqqE/SkfB family radical SAM enzyme